MKYAVLLTTIGIMLALLSGTANATGGWGYMKHATPVEVQVDQHAKSKSEARAKAKAKAEAQARSKAASNAKATGGKAQQDQTQKQAQQANSGSDVTIGGDTYSQGGDNYDVAAIPGTLYTNHVCQSGTDIRGVKLGASTIRPSAECLLWQQATTKIAAAGALECEAYEGNGKGGVVHASGCQRMRSELMASAMEDFALSRQLLCRKPGLFKAIGRVFWSGGFKCES